MYTVEQLHSKSNEELDVILQETKSQVGRGIKIALIMALSAYSTTLPAMGPEGEGNG